MLDYACIHKWHTMKLGKRLFRASWMAVALVLISGHGFAQGFLRTVTFDAPRVPPGNNIGFTYYYEDSVTFTPIAVGEQFVRAGGGVSFFPENGTTYILQGFNNTLAGYRDQLPTPSHFGLYSVDLSEFSTLYDFPRTIQFVGYLFDGSTVSTEFTTDGIIDGTGLLADFQTFYFDSQFNDIVRFEVPTHTYAMDNLVFFDVIPEPTTGALLIVGGVTLWLMRSRKSRHA